MHEILIGSFTLDGDIVCAGVSKDGSNLRYVEGSLMEARKGETMASLLFRIYDSSKGCMINGGFERTAEES